MTEVQRLSDREIRVLDLLPGAQDDDVRCDIRTVSLDDHVEYEALSYVWGALTELKEIGVSGRRVQVTPNLYAALRRLRYPEKIRTVWTDQLCIKQWHTSEKSSQVAMMRDIYRNCTQCIIWLGEIPEANADYSLRDAEAVFDYIKTVAAVETSPLYELPTLFQDNSEGEGARKAFEAFVMYGNPWWTRIWTVQEAIIPKSAVLVWGHLTVPRHDIMVVSRVVQGNRMRSYFSEAFVEKRVQHYELLRRLLYPVRGFTHSIIHDGPLDLLMRWRYRDATDPRDKVYALLGLVQEGLPSAQGCDYSITASTLFSKTTMDLIRLEAGLRPLLGSSEMPHQTPELPTWAIDFACSNRVGKRQLKWWCHSHRYRQFSACGKQRLDVSVSEDAKILTLTGAFIDEIAAVHEPFITNDHEDIDDRKLYETVVSCKEVTDRRRASQGNRDEYIGGGTWEEALWRTMIGDLVMREVPVERAQISHGGVFSTMLGDLAEGRGGQSLYESLCGMVPNQTFFLTKAGYMGLGPPQTSKGDQVWVFSGGQVPFVMRTHKETVVSEECPELTFVGDAYVHGIMDGEAVPDGHQARTVKVH